jgi:hypothetical protein
MLENRFNVAQALSRTVEQPLVDFAPNALAIAYEGELWVFVDDPDISSPAALKAATDIYDAVVSDSVSAVHYVLTEWAPDDHERVTMGLGRSAVTVRLALRKLLDLPSTFDASQKASIDEALSTIHQMNVNPIRMALVDRSGERHFDAARKLSEMLQTPRTTGGGLLFIEAEAGKGKTILLASAAQSMSTDKRGKLPIFIPLRKLPLESGVAWESITQLIGIVGEGAERLVRAIKAGLITIFLDGIDEVAGRYDKNLIRDLLQLMTDRLGSQESVVVLSGRRTQARHLNTNDWQIFSVELPELDSTDFKGYVGSVLDALILQSKVPVKVPQEYVDLMGDRPADDQVIRERDNIVEWILDIFPEVAKEPTLFFVQGLAAIAIGRRAGNRATLRSHDGKPYVPPIWDVCLSAAVFACIRERSKIDSIAELEYSVENQMCALQGFAALSSAPSFANKPTPNELVPGAFHVDPINSPEVYVAITRQNAKHALLYASEAAGAYRPQFLSDWIRCFLIAQVFDSNPPLGQFNRDEVLKLVASAERARYTFDLLLPSALKNSTVRAEWLHAFDAAVAAGFEAASANQWALRAAVGDARLNAIVCNPLPLAEITDAEFFDFAINKELSGDNFFLDGTQFADSSLTDVRLEAVSMRAVIFANCDISNLELVGCDGPISFEDCTLKSLKISNIRSNGKPALTFDNCSFLGGGNLITQEKPAYGEDDYATLVVFKGCFTDSDINTLLVGDWAAKDSPIAGICKEVARTVSKPEACLRRSLRAFFPSHIGSGSALQARPYIRLSAFGRGRMPAGSPGQEELQRIFEAQGFTTGGRPDHLYGPWSSVAGASASGVALRNELLDFLLDSTKRGPSVQRMLGKIAQYFPKS